MFNLLNAWNNFWNRSPSAKMPLTEKVPGEPVAYPYAVKKTRIDDDIEIAYTDEGIGGADVLLFIHGMGTDLSAWGKNMDSLSKDFRCIALDLPGHGLSDKGDFPYTIQFYTQCVISFIKKLDLPALTLIGHSMGGQIAVNIAIKQPVLADKLVLVSPSGVEPYTAVERQMLINTMTGIVASGNAFTHNRLNQILGFPNHLELASEFANGIALYQHEAAHFGILLSRSVEAMLLEGINGVLHQITQPCLILVGEEDLISPWPYMRGEDFARLLAAESSQIRDVKLVTVPACGHYLPYQMPEAFNDELLKFIEEKSAVSETL
ncbi:alpha/beta fold hydrolase [Dyadobacter sp. CY323]|uniref:alpha/beta fold hydrolase n=1 Tax=Dyadobacter sp. CY323 TaxID=2907302 RepID=UPI001F386949|nr:alpha/beta hydrolase [Dyadobacter sp. CY323]MCE6991281.1 alpha/beta hydrolase [Dyadobacter sp. CY323]